MTKPLPRKLDKKFLSDAFKMITNYLEETLSAKKPVINFHLPDKLKSIIDFEIRDQGVSPQELIKQCGLVMEHQIRPHHPHFHNQLFGGFDQYSLVGNWITSSINGTMFTYQVAPCYTIMEDNIYKHLATRIGWKNIDGIMTPGGSFANWNGMLCARHKKFPQSKLKGIQGLPPLRILTSKASHYSISKGAILQGLGLDNIINVASNDKGEMIPEELEAQIQKSLERGEAPYFANITVGTSVAGAIDPVEQSSRICRKYGIWAHMDAAFGGAFFMSDKLRQKIGNCQNIDSVTWDPHKALVVPLQATFFLTQHPGLMQQCNSTKADVVFHKYRKSYEQTLDTGDKTLQCGRPIDILKCWTAFKGNGWKGIAEQVQSQHNLALHLTNRIINSKGKWILVYPTATFNVSYYYVPQQLRNSPKDQIFYKTLSKINIIAKKYMIDDGKILIGYATNGKNDNYFWRNVMSNPYITNKEVDYELDLLEGYCEKGYRDLKESRQ